MSLRVGLDARFGSARYDGVGRYVSELANGLPRLTGAPTLHLLRPDQSDASRHPLPADGDRVFTLPQRRAWRAETPRSWLTVPRLARAAGLDVWHTPYPLAPPVTGTASVVTLHDCIPERNPGYFGMAHRLAYRAAVAVALRTAALVIVPSEFTAEDAQRFHGVSSARLRIVALGVAPCPIVASAAAATRSALGLPDTYILTVGRPRPHKRYTTLVRALGALAASRRPPLVRVGRSDPRLPDGSDELAAALKVPLRVLSGLSDGELTAVYAGATLVAIPSSVEGFGLPLLEAMAAGAPVLASDIQPLRACGGQVARYVDGDENAWADAVAAAVDDVTWRHWARLAGPQRAALFPWGATAQGTLEVYTEAV